MPRTSLLTGALVAALAACLMASSPMTIPDLPQLESMTARFAPVDLSANVSELSASERRALSILIDAARLVDGLFLRQTWAGSESQLLQLAADTTPLGRARLRYFVVNKGPWSRLDHNAPFLPGVGDRPAQANFYPLDATRAEVEAWLGSLPQAERAAASGFFTVIRRGPDGRLRAVPYSQEYQPQLAMLAAKLREAAAHTVQPTLERFLETRAAALGSDDYYESDVAWMELDASIEPTIGPYEVYEDEWFNYKAAFEAFITVRDDEETSRLRRFGGELQGLEDALPVDARFRNPRLGALAPIAVVNVVFTAGDANHDVQTAAFNLPNDERVTLEKGSKRVMLKNVQEAKFQKVLLPIAAVLIPAGDRSRVSFDAFFTHILMHELMHGLGPQTVTAGGQTVGLRQQLKETYSTIEEAKADVSGLWALQRLIDTGRLDRQLEETMYVTFLASAFRSIRFGISEAHGRGIAIQLNKFLDAGAVVANPDGTYAVRPGPMKQAVSALTRELMTLEGEGNYAAAKTLLTSYGTVRPEIQRALERLTPIPVDIAPRFVTADQLSAQP